MRQRDRRAMRVGLLTVKAPGTEKSTTFFPFHSSVESLMAGREAEEPFSTGCATARRVVLTDATGGGTLKLGRVGDVLEGAGGDGVADVDRGGHCVWWVCESGIRVELAMSGMIAYRGPRVGFKACSIRSCDRSGRLVKGVKFGEESNHARHGQEYTARIV